MPSVLECESLPVAAARSGEPGAWEALLRRYQLPLYVFAFELLREETAARDVVQETFIAATRHLDGLREDAKFGSWLFSIAHQKCGHAGRRRGREREWLAEQASAPEEFAADPREDLIRQEDEAEFLRVLAELPEAHRAVLLLHYLEDFSLAEIAGITAAPLGTVKSRLHYAKQTLRQRLLERNP